MKINTLEDKLTDFQALCAELQCEITFHEIHLGNKEDLMPLQQAARSIRTYVNSVKEYFNKGFVRDESEIETMDSFMHRCVNGSVKLVSIKLPALESKRTRHTTMMFNLAAQDVVLSDQKPVQE